MRWTSGRPSSRPPTSRSTNDQPPPRRLARRNGDIGSDACRPGILATLARPGWPNRFVRLIVPFPPGGGTDAIARVLSAKLSDLWGQQLVIENRGGGATNIGTEAVVRADPDGYTMLFQSMPLAVNRFLFPSLSFDAAI